jgi:hypothetical protein
LWTHSSCCWIWRFNQWVHLSKQVSKQSKSNHKQIKWEIDKVCWLICFSLCLSVFEINCSVGEVVGVTKVLVIFLINTLHIDLHFFVMRILGLLNDQMKESSTNNTKFIIDILCVSYNEISFLLILLLLTTTTKFQPNTHKQTNLFDKCIESLCGCFSWMNFTFVWCLQSLDIRRTLYWIEFVILPNCLCFWLLFLFPWQNQIIFKSFV